MMQLTIRLLLPLRMMTYRPSQSPRLLKLLAGSDAMFKLSANIQPFESLAIKYIPTNTPVTGGNFLRITDEQNMSLGNSGDERTSERLPFVSEDDGNGNITYVATLPVPTIQDPSDATLASGSFSVTLVAVADKYSISNIESEYKASVSVIKVPNPTLSIRYNGTLSTAITEGDNPMFTIVASEDPKRPLNVNYTPDDGTDDFIKADPDNNIPAAGTMRTAENKTFTPFDDNGTMRWKN